MKKFVESISIIAMLVSSPALAVNVNATCDLAVVDHALPGDSVIGTLGDAGLRRLITKGYHIYHVKDASEVSSGLRLSTERVCDNHWYGRNCGYRVSVFKKNADGRDLLLDTSSSPYSVNSATEGLIETCFESAAFTGQKQVNEALAKLSREIGSADSPKISNKSSKQINEAPQTSEKVASPAQAARAL